MSPVISSSKYLIFYTTSSYLSLSRAKYKLSTLDFHLFPAKRKKRPHPEYNRKLKISHHRIRFSSKKTRKFLYRIISHIPIKTNDLLKFIKQRSRSRRIVT